MKIEKIEIGRAFKPFVIAEVAQTHEGSLGNAYRFIEIAKECGADAIKFQTHIAEEESTPHEQWRVPFSFQDKSRYDYWKRISFTKEQWIGLKEYADKIGIVFMSSAFSLLACEWLESMDMAVWKIASGEVHNKELISRIKSTGKPIIVSSGLSTFDETDSIINDLNDIQAGIALMQCTTKYPTPPEEVGINIVEAYLNKYPNIPIGLSDHSGSVFPGIVAAYLGASIIEVHLTMHENMFGPDVVASLTPRDLKQMINGIRYSYLMRQNPINKDNQVEKQTVNRTIFGRSLYASRYLSSGTILTGSDIAYKKPGGGLSYDERKDLIGKKIRVDIEKDHQFNIKDVE